MVVEKGISTWHRNRTMKSTTTHVTSSSTWKFLLLGGIFGFVLAVISTNNTNNSFSHRERSFSGVSRWLLEETNDESLVESSEAPIEEHEEEEESEESLDAVTMDTTVALIVLLLIVLTIGFETIKEHVEESADRNMRPIIASLFGEMTVLGFLSIFTFCVTKLGFFEELSIQLFGEEEEEALLETFEFVHYMLFFIMVFFVISVLALVGGAKQMERQWTTMDKACRDPDYMRALDDLQSDNERNSSSSSSSSGQSPPSWFSYLTQSLMIPPCFRNRTKIFRESLSLFRGLRTEFTLERSLVSPFAPNATNNVDKDFEYGRYLGICLGHELAHIVHVNLVTWCVFALLTLFFYVLMMILNNRLTTFAWVWAAMGWILVLLGNYFDYHILSILHKLAALPATRTATNSNENDALLALGPLPAWTQIDMDEYRRNRSFVTKCFGHGPSYSSRLSKQDALYWMDRKGPKLYLIIFQVQLVFSSAYVSLLLLSFVERVYQMLPLTIAILYTVISVLPIYFLVSRFQTSAANMTMACSFGIHRRPQAISQVIRDEKVDRIIRALVIVHKLERAAAAGFAMGDNASGTESSGSANGQQHSYGHSVELEQVAKSFDALDPSGDGKIESGELKKVLHALGAHTTDENMDAMLRVLDRNHDGHIAKDEFLDFYSQHVLTAVDHDGIHELAHNLYHQFDQDQSGEITLGEFKTVLDAFNVGFTVDEIGHLVNELDEHDDGTVGEHEFLELLRKHIHLFEDIKLPPLT